MEFMKMSKKYSSFDLQILGDEKDGDGKLERKFTQTDVDKAVKDRLRREKRKWERQHQNETSFEDLETEGKTCNSGIDDESEDIKKLKERAAKADELELKWICIEHGADKANIDDLIALAKVYVARNNMDIEDAIDVVLKKYPIFKLSFNLN